jgi:drug/metabolite transporter (DMT)-like permease
VSTALDQPTTSAASARRFTGVCMLFAAATLWSLSGVVVKVVQVPSLTFTMWRSIGAALLMLALVRFSKGRVPANRWMLFSVVANTLVVSLLITAMTLSTAAAGILLQYTGPVFCALLAWVFQGRKIGAGTAAALAIATAGVAIMLVGGGAPGGWVGPTAGLLSGLAFGAFILVLERLDRTVDNNSNPFAVVCLNNLGTAILILPVTLYLGQAWAEPWKIGLVVLTGMVQLAVPYVLFQLALRRVSPVEASLLILAEPVLNPVWVWLATGEQPGWATFAGGAAILLALVVEVLHKPGREEEVDPPRHQGHQGRHEGVRG